MRTGIKAEYPDSGSYHPYAQVGPFIKVGIYNQWDESAKRWADARVATVWGLRFGKHGLGITFRRRIPRGIVAFGGVSAIWKDHVDTRKP